ncbi:MAG: hypothetical protein IKC87_08095 [Clostridia bacterium]|nr:hypothetical protein [Clostridia bacterium]
MTEKDRIYFSRLEDTFKLNFKITNLYARYLELCPELITKEMIDLLTEGGALTREEAIVAILSEAFGLDIDGSAEERKLIRDYLIPSVRMLDAKRYTENPYYKNIRVENIKDGAWEYRCESYPAYRGVICHDMIINEDLSEIPPLGFFPEEFKFPAVLEDGNEWMTLTPVDLDTSDEAIEAARGKVVTFGLGLGYYAYMCSEKPEVESITIIEKSPDVIRLFRTHILPQFGHPEKVRIIEADAFEYAEKDMPAECYDLAFVDTWRDASDGTPMYERMKPLERLSPNTKFLYWIENFLISRRRAVAYEKVSNMLRSGDKDAPRSFDEALSIITREAE